MLQSKYLELGLVSFPVSIVGDSFHIHQKVEVAVHVLICEFLQRMIFCSVALPTAPPRSQEDIGKNTHR